MGHRRDTRHDHAAAAGVARANINGAAQPGITRTDGARPLAGLIAVGGTLFGTTFSGGPHGAGTVFAFDPVTGTETVLHSFTGGADGANPDAALLSLGGVLYGTTFGAGVSPHGTVFAINPTSGAVGPLHSFTGGSDGAASTGALIAIGGMLYGTTSEGGSATGRGGNGCGTVFALNPLTKAETILHAFTGRPDGSQPAGLLNVNGILYGTTMAGGASRLGTVYTVDPASDAYTVVYSFAGGTDGDTPNGPMIDVDGTLYGSTGGGGGSDSEDGFGTVFTFDPATGAEKVLYAFASSNGTGSYPNPVIDVGGLLLGSTGGVSTVFAINPTTGVEITLAQFHCTNSSSCPQGAGPQGSLVELGGALYDTTSNGGASPPTCHGNQSCGTVFSLTR